MGHKVILISGKMGSGKSSLQSELYNRLPQANKYNFADPLYQLHDGIQQMMAYIFPDITCKVRKIPKDGPLLQILGTNWARHFDEEIWVKTAKLAVGKLLREKYAPIIIADCRFRNEFDAWDSTDALKIRLSCDETVRKSRCSMWRDNTAHPSEIDLDMHASQGKFDLHYDTETMDIESIADDVLKNLKV